MEAEKDMKKMLYLHLAMVSGKNFDFLHETLVK